MWTLVRYPIVGKLGLSVKTLTRNVFHLVYVASKMRTLLFFFKFSSGTYTEMLYYSYIFLPIWLWITISHCIIVDSSIEINPTYIYFI